MQTKNPAFSLLELVTALAIIAILSSIAIPSYKYYINKVKIAQIFTIIHSYKIFVTEAYLHQEEINKRVENPFIAISTISIKTLKTIDVKPSYVIQAVINSDDLGLHTKTGEQPLLINFIGTPISYGSVSRDLGELNTDELLSWHCQIQSGYDLEMPEICIAKQLSKLES